MSAPVAKVEIDGKIVEVPPGTMVMEAANRLGIYVPHFCYHKKLSIAANCRMCLVEIEKAPKPMPACATPVTDGMKVQTHSVKAKQAQQGVMEFLLINHPLDCPICDQGGECQLQDLAVGYGGSASRFGEDKRVVLSKDIGPLVAAEEMSRCIQCTRCVRFGQEIAGVMELGMMGRGEHSEIVSFVGRTVDSELSGNMIDICPVGALTSKPFRYSARTWELSRRKSIAPHDSLGSNVVVQVKGNRVMRVVPLENEAVNECWLSDRDRFSYEGLNSDQRLVKPMLRDGSGWREVDWQVALEHVAARLREIAGSSPASIGALAGPTSTLEEMHLLARVMRGIGSANVDFRLRHSDFSADSMRKGVPWLGMPVSELGNLDRVLVVGSFLRKDHPLVAARLRLAAKRGQRLHLLQLAGDDPLIERANRVVLAPSAMTATFAGVVRAACELKQQPVPAELANVVVSDATRAIAMSLAEGRIVGVLLGNSAQQHPQAAVLHALAQRLAQVLGGRMGFLGETANSVGGYLAGCTPGTNGLNAAGMLANPRAAYLLLNTEPELDAHDARQAMAAMKAAKFVVALSAYRTAAVDYAHVLLPIAPFTESSGTFVNAEGRSQSFSAVVRPMGDARPGWKVLRVLGNLLGLKDFEFESSEQVRDAVVEGGITARLDNAIEGVALHHAGASSSPAGAFERAADVPIYCVDSIVRRAPALQRSNDAQAPKAWMSAGALQRIGIAAGARARLRQGDGAATLEVAVDPALPDNVVRVAAGHPSTMALGAMFGAIIVERA